MAVLTKHFSVAAANLAVLAITNNVSPKYVFISHPLPWVDNTNTWNDNIIPQANISAQQSETNTYNEIVFGKLITELDVIRMAPRYDWNNGSIYTAYSGTDENLFNENFYVVTDDLNVYKCIDNNFGGRSTVKPTVVSTFGTFFTSDGYVWKYMFTIPSDTNIKFTTTNFIPVVPNTFVTANAVPGTVDAIDISSFGNGYSAFYSGFLQNAVNGYVVVIDGNAAPYNNFYVGSSMYLKAGFGAGQLRQIVSYDGLNKLVRFNTPFDTFATLSLANVAGTFNIGDTLLQNIDILSIVYPQGTFQVGDSVVQSDTGANGIVTGSNTTVLQIIRNSTNTFNLTYPVYDTVSNGTVGPGTATVQSFTELYTLSNTANFTNGEFMYQSNGTANIGTGILFGTTTLPSVNTNFNPLLAVNVAASFIAIANNPYANLAEILYTTSTGNTPVFPLVNNTIYFTSFSNSSGIAVSSASGGSNLVLTVTKTETFNPNTGINGNSFITIAGQFVVNGQIVVYTVSPGNTVPVGLANGASYFVTHANSTGLNLSASFNGPNVSITPTTHNETGHTISFTIPPETGHKISFTQQKLTISQVSGLFGNVYQVKGNTSHANAVLQTANLDPAGLAYAFSTNTAQTTFTTTFPANTYIRLGTNTNTNIRRVVSSNSSCVVLDTGLLAPAVANLTYVIPNATEIISYTLLSANGVVVNTNLQTMIVSYSNSTLFGTIFIPGERVDMVDNIGTFQGTYGICSYSNTSSVVIAQISGPGFLHGFYISGESSKQTAYINTLTNYPTVTIEDPLGQFIVGQTVYSRSTANLTVINGTANLISFFITPGQQTEYVISPTVTISGDGFGALAYSTINTNPLVNLPIANVIIIDSGSGYTYANISITSNLSYGSGATALARVSPLLGHGFNAYEELGASYVSISTGIANSVLESYHFPMFGNYRKVGILDTPLFNDLQVDISYYDRVKLSINHPSNTFSVGEVVYQPNSSAAGVVVYANNTYLELNNVKGTFSANGKFANNASSNDNVVGLYSSAIANVSFQITSFFDVVSNDQIVYEVSTGTQAVIVDLLSQNNLQLTNVGGGFSSNDMLFDPTTNAYGFISSMYTVNGTINSTNGFGLRFNQTLRIPITSTSGQFQLYETVTQVDGNANASGLVIGGSVSVPGSVSVNIGNDVDISYSNTVGSFPIGSIIYNTGNAGVGIVISSNSSYLRLTAVNGHFTSGDQITSTIGSTCTSGNVFPVMILNNVDGNWTTGVLSGNIVGSNTGTVGRCDTFNVILYPDLVRDSGQVMYFENLAPFSLSNNSQEVVSLIMAF